MSFLKKARRRFKMRKYKRVTHTATDNFKNRMFEGWTSASNKESWPCKTSKGWEWEEVIVRLVVTSTGGIIKAILSGRG